MYPITAEEWEDGFRRDMNPDREIGMWCCMAVAFSQFADEFTQSLDHKKETFQLILACVNNGTNQTLQTTSRTWLSRPRAKRVVAYMKEMMSH